MFDALSHECDKITGNGIMETLQKTLIAQKYPGEIHGSHLASLTVLVWNCD